MSYILYNTFALSQTTFANLHLYLVYKMKTRRYFVFGKKNKIAVTKKMKKSHRDKGKEIDSRYTY